MSKSLLREFVPFKYSKQEVLESTQQIGGNLRVKGVLQRANAKNHNGRVYPKEILSREIDRYISEFVDQNRALGELDHPESAEVNLANASHNIIKIWWEGDDVMGLIEILPTPSGNILKNLLLSGITVGISSRGVGSVREMFSEDRSPFSQVQEDFELTAFDFVSNPSTQGAFMRPVNESRNYPNKISQEEKVGQIIADIICDVRGICEC